MMSTNKVASCTMYVRTYVHYAKVLDANGCAAVDVSNNSPSSNMYVYMRKGSKQNVILQNKIRASEGKERRHKK